MKLSIDKISITGHIKYDDLLESRLRMIGCRVTVNPAWNYRKCGFIPQSDGSNGIIQWEGTQTNIKGRYRLEFNPNKLSWQLESILSLMPKINHDLRTVRFTRMDLAVDIFEPFNSFEFNYKYGVKKRYFVGRDGQIESVYFGSNSSEKMVRCYDKAKEQGIEKDWTRVEVQIRKDILYSDLNDFTFNSAFDEFILSKHRTQQNFLDDKAIPIEYRALMLYLEQHPHYEGELGRVKKQKLNVYREMSKDEIDIKSALYVQVREIIEGIRILITGQSQQYRKVEDIFLSVRNEALNEMEESVSGFYIASKEIQKAGQEVFN
jgi:hypothetical protein